MKRFLILISSILLLTQAPKKYTKIDEKLLEKLSRMKDDEKVKVFINFSGRNWEKIFSIQSYEERIKYMREEAFEIQKNVLNYLKSKLGEVEELYQGWTAIRLFAKLPKWIIFEISEKFPEIESIKEDELKKYLPEDYEPHILNDFFPGEDYVSGSVLNVKADEAWRRGYKGKGIIVGNMDTGVDVNHPVLKNSYRGISAWYDAVGTLTSPQDSNGHGTGTMGFLVGSHGIGIAPGSKWIAVKILNANGSGTTANIQEGFDWVAGLPDSLRPHLMSNSWGSTATTDTTFWPNIKSWLAVGIIPVFAIGNGGPNGSTAGTPGNFPMVFGIGGTWWPSEEIMSYSSRGPAPNQVPWTRTFWWPRSDWNRHKPDLIAPSEPTVTAAPDGEYQSFGGTSAACPHAAGVLALLLQANTFKNITSAGYDTARIRRIYKYMTDYAYWNPSWGNPSNTPGLRDTFGWGRVDAEKYISNLPEPQVPHIFIDTVYVLSTTDGDRNIEPEENIQIRIRLKNTGANATSVTGKITYRTNNAITIVSGALSFGNIPRFGSAEQTFTLSSSDILPQNTRIYFTFKITATGYTKHDFFYLDTWKQEEASQTKTLKNDNGTAYYYPGNDPEYNNYKYFASRFETANTGTMIACSIYCYAAAAVTETLFVWDHNSTYDAPGNLIAYRVISVTSGNEWKYFDIPDIAGIPAGYIWVGVNKGDAYENGVPYQDNDGASTTNKSTNTRTNPSSWTLQNWWYDFMIRPRITYDPIVSPSIFYEGSYVLDDSRSGNGDGWIDPGEQAYLAISLKNLGILAQNVVCTLKTADPYTQQRIQIIKNVSNFGDAPYGNPSTNNYNDPWIIRCWDEDSMRGTQDFLFIVKVVATYYRANPGSGGPYTYTKTLNFTISSPFIPYENTWWWIPSGVGPVYTGNMGSSYYYHTDFYFGLNHPMDSFTIDSVYFGLYNSGNASRTATLRIRRAADPPSFAPTTTNLWSGTQSVPANTYNWYFLRPNIKVPAWVWWHEYLPSVAAGGLEPLLREPFVGSLTLVDATDGAPWGDVGYFIYCLPFYFKLRHGHATISYYRPSTWSWPITPTNQRNSTTIPSILNSWPDTTFANFAILNRSGIDLPAPPSNTARGPRGEWDNYLFLDNWGQWNATVNVALPAWNYLTAKNLYLKVPGGRHTILIGLDWNNEVGGNVFNEYLRYWGMQFSWNAKDLYARNAPKRIKWVPDLTGPFAGPYYNATVYACSLRTSPLIPSYGKPWHAVGIRNFNLTWDNDLDLRLYSDKPSDPYSGYTNVIEASELGPGKVDYIMMDGHHLSTKYYAGVYSFISPQNSRPDSTWMQFEMARYVITTGTTWNYLDDNFTDSTILHVYDVIINNRQTFSCSLITLSGTQDFGIALYRSTSEDRFKRRIDYLVASDVIAPGKEYITYTNTGANDTFGLIVYGNLNSSGTYRLKFLGTAQPLGIMEEEFYAEVVREGIILKWGNIEGAKEFYVEKLNNKGYERIAKIYPPQNEYLDKDVKNGKEYTYRLIINYGDKQKILGPITILYITPLPSELTILKIDKVIKKDGILKVAVPENEKIEILIYDVSGRISQTIFKGFLPMGIYEFNLKKNSKGVYFVVLRDKKKEIREKVIFF
jgi:hypothetical protein